MVTENMVQKIWWSIVEFAILVQHRGGDFKTF